MEKIIYQFVLLKNVGVFGLPSVTHKESEKSLVELETGPRTLIEKNTAFEW